MEGKVVLITGAKGGLGTAITRAFLAAGALVVGTSRSIKQTDFPESNFTAIAADLTHSSEAEKLVSEVIARFQKIDVLVHVTGGFAAGKIHETDDETWNRMRDLNTTSAFNIAREVILSMRRSGGGRIIAIGSLAATEPRAGIGAYVVSKTALTTLFRTIALENADAGITSNVVMPATMDTPANRTDMPNADASKWVKPEDVAKLVMYLADERADKITGAVIPVYGPRP